jgi:hypothetical protein
VEYPLNPAHTVTPAISGLFLFLLGTGSRAGKLLWQKQPVSLLNQPDNACWQIFLISAFPGVSAELENYGNTAIMNY